MSKNVKKILTVDDLYNFCLEKGLSYFSAKEYGTSLRVQVPGYFAKLESDKYTLYADIRICHTGKNRNTSALQDKAAKHCMDTLAYKPLLANFTDVNGEWDFTSHDFTIETDENGNEIYNYQEKQIGCFTTDKPYMKYDEELGHNYMYGKVAIPRDYTRAADIIERKKGTKVSVELDILEMSFNAKDKLLSLDDAVITGCTCLGVNPETGDPIGEGMEGASISLESFSAENNGVFTTELLDELRKFNKNFETINNNSKEGGKDIVNKELFEELLAKYEVTEDQIEFEYDNLSDVELEEKFQEVYGENKGDDAPSENDEPNENFEDETEGNTSSNNDDSDSSDDDSSASNGEEDNNAELNSVQCSMLIGENKVEFATSLSDQLYALTQLVNSQYEVDNTWYSVDAYTEPNKYVVMQDIFTGRAYKQEFKVRKDEYQLIGDRVEVFVQFLTKDEISELDNMRKNYSKMTTKLSAYESEPEKLEIFESEEWSLIKDTEKFAELSKRENYFNLSKDEITEKLNEMILEFAKNPENANFAVKEDKEEIEKTEKAEKKNTFNVKPLLPNMTSNKKKSRYGNLFSKND